MNRRLNIFARSHSHHCDHSLGNRKVRNRQELSGSAVQCYAVHHHCAAVRRVTEFTQPPFLISRYLFISTCVMQWAWHVVYRSEMKVYNNFISYYFKRVKFIFVDDCKPLMMLITELWCCYRLCIICFSGCFEYLILGGVAQCVLVPRNFYFIVDIVHCSANL